MKDQAKKSLFNHLGLKILSLLLAIIIWMIIMNLDDYSVTKTVRDIPVEEMNGSTIENLGKVYNIVDGDTVDVVVKGPRSLVDPLTAADFTATANLAELSITNTVQIVVKLNDSQLSSRVQMNPVDANMNLDIEDVVSKELPVKAVTKGSVATDYAMGSAKVTPNIVNITGPESLINRITDIRAEVDVSGMYSAFQKTVEPICVDAYGETVNGKHLSMSVETVTVDAEIEPTKVVPIKVNTTGAPATGYSITSIKYNPQSITIAGAAEDLEAINAIYVSGLSVAGLNETKEYDLKLAEYLPEGVFLADTDDMLAVAISFEKLAQEELTFKPEELEILGRDDENLEYALTLGAGFKVRLTGLQDNLSGVSKESLQLKVDATDLEAGEYEPKVTYAVPKNVSVSVIGKVKLTVTEKEPATETEGETEDGPEGTGNTPNDGTDGNTGDGTGNGGDAANGTGNNGTGNNGTTNNGTTNNGTANNGTTDNGTDDASGDSTTGE